MRRLFAGVIAFLGISCSNGETPGSPDGSDDDPQTTPSAPASIQITPSTVSLPEGDQRQLTAVVRDAAGQVLASAQITWQANSSSIVTVSNSGLITARAPGGPVPVFAVVGNVSSSAQITVTPRPATTTPLAGGTIYAGANQVSAFPGGPTSNEIVALNPSTGVMTNLTQHPANDQFPRVSPDGTHLIYATDRFPGSAGLMRSDGANASAFGPSCASIINACIFSASWLADGRIIFYYQNLDASGQQRAVGTRTTVSPAIQFTNVPISFPNSAAYAPAGDVATYQSNGILLTARVSNAQVTTIAAACTFASACTTLPIWSASGQFIYALRQSALWEFSANGGTSRQLYAATSSSGIEAYALSPDGLQMAVIENGFAKVFSLSSPTNVRTLFSPIPDVFTTIDASAPIVWSPDSRSVAFVGTDNLPHRIYGVNVDGSGLKLVGEVGFAHGLAWGR
jgi:hypothetical protein